MKERGLTFTADSVRAILAGTKSQTRRVCKLFGCEVVEERDGVPWVFSPQHDGWIACPYGFVGGRLYVKETFATMCHVADPCCSCDDEDKARNHYVEYRADLAPECTDRPGGWPRSPVDDEAPRWKSPRFMPRAASRITLELTSVRVERLQSITQADVIAEGVKIPVAPSDTKGKVWPLLAVTGKFPSCQYMPNPKAPVERDYYVAAYASMWDRINHARAPWASNPFVWVLEFKMVQP